MEIIIQRDCVQFVYESGEIVNVYPGESVSLPEGLTTEQKADVMEALSECEINNNSLKAESDAENETFAEAVAAIEAEEDAKRSAEIRKQLIAAGVIKP